MARELQNWRLIARREVHSGPRITISVDTVELPDGTIVDDYYRLRLIDFAVIFARTREGRILS